RQESPRIPPRVIREALVNALMHRSYQIHGPIEVIRFANRLEIHNPGHSLKPVEHLGEPGSKPRNPNIASVLHETNYAETKGSGIRVMQELMKGANLTPPTFESDRETDQFTATFLLHHFLDKQDVAWLAHFRDLGLSDDEARILIHAREKGGVNEIAEQNSSDLRVTPLETPLADYSKEIPDRSLGQAPAKSESLPTNLQSIPTNLPPTSSTLPAMKESKPTMKKSKPTMKESKPTMKKSKPTMKKSKPAVADSVPPLLIKPIKELGRKSPPSRVQEIIARICVNRAYTADELAAILNRNKKWVKCSYLFPMIRDGILEYTIPENPKHRNQAYRTRNRNSKGMDRFP
ncbi:MAG: hypothetical protein NTV68_00050, partial [Methanomicrobiales archaeon]|nr:hypothetical protein [Methanomicrobiales archaeon]